MDGWVNPNENDVRVTCMGNLGFQDKLGRKVAIHPPMRGQFSHAFLTQSLSMQVSFRYVKELPFEQWNAEWFDACNPRAWLPIKLAFGLLNNQGKTRATRTFRAWVERMNSARHVDDSEREQLSNEVLQSLLSSGYVWIAAIAWLLEQLEWSCVVDLCTERFGGRAGDHSVYTPSSSPAVVEKYRQIELAIMRENLLREYAGLEDVIIAAFSETIDKDAIERHRARTLNIVVRLAKMHVTKATLPAPPAGSPAPVKVISEGYLGHIVILDLLPVSTHAKALMRNPTHPAWVRRFSSW
jgi:hypothetical protein